MANTLTHKQSFISLFLALLIWLPAAYAIDLDTLFRVKQGTTEGGMDSHKDVVQKQDNHCQWSNHVLTGNADG